MRAVDIQRRDAKIEYHREMWSAFVASGVAPLPGMERDYALQTVGQLVANGMDYIDELFLYGGDTPTRDVGDPPASEDPEGDNDET